MRLPLLVHATPKVGLKGNCTISAGRWSVEFDSDSPKMMFGYKFSLKLYSPSYPDGLELENTDEFYVTGSTKIVFEMLSTGHEKHISIHLRRVASGVQYHSNAQ